MTNGDNKKIIEETMVTTPFSQKFEDGQQEPFPKKDDVVTEIRAWMLDPGGTTGVMDQGWSFRRTEFP